MRIPACVVAFAAGAAGVGLVPAPGAPLTELAMAPASATASARVAGEDATVLEARATVYRRSDGAMVVACVAEVAHELRGSRGHGDPAVRATVPPAGSRGYTPLSGGGIEATLVRADGSPAAHLDGLRIRDLAGHGVWLGVRFDGRVDLGRLPVGSFILEATGAAGASERDRWSARTAPFFHDGSRLRHDLVLVEATSVDVWG